MPFRYEEYERSAAQPNVVVDGSPNAGTVLTLTHWPGFIAPDHLGGGDQPATSTSATMPFSACGAPPLPKSAGFVFGVVPVRMKHTST